MTRSEFFPFSTKKRNERKNNEKKRAKRKENKNKANKRVLQQKLLFFCFFNFFAHTAREAFAPKLWKTFLPETKDCDNSDLLLWYDNTRRAEKKHAFSAKTGKFRSFGSYTCKSGQCPRKFADTHSFDTKKEQKAGQSAEVIPQKLHGGSYVRSYLISHEQFSLSFPQGFLYAVLPSSASSRGRSRMLQEDARRRYESP